MLAISNAERQIVLTILQQYVPEYEVWAFGSRIKDNAKPYSDLDLAVITEQPLSLERHADLVDAFSESDLPWKVDIVDWAATSENFRQIIQSQFEVFQRSKESK